MISGVLSCPVGNGVVCAERRMNTKTNVRRLLLFAVGASVVVDHLGFGVIRWKRPRDVGIRLLKKVELQERC